MKKYPLLFLALIAIIFFQNKSLAFNTSFDCSISAGEHITHCTDINEFTINASHSGLNTFSNLQWTGPDGFEFSFPATADPLLHPTITYSSDGSPTDFPEGTFTFNLEALCDETTPVQSSVDVTFISPPDEFAIYANDVPYGGDIYNVCEYTVFSLDPEIENNGENIVFTLSDPDFQFVEYTTDGDIRIALPRGQFCEDLTMNLSYNLGGCSITRQVQLLVENRQDISIPDGVEYCNLCTDDLKLPDAGCGTVSLSIVQGPGTMSPPDYDKYDGVYCFSEPGTYTLRYEKIGGHCPDIIEEFDLTFHDLSVIYDYDTEIEMCAEPDPTETICYTFDFPLPQGCHAGEWVSVQSWMDQFWTVDPMTPNTVEICMPHDYPYYTIEVTRPIECIQDPKGFNFCLDDQLAVLYSNTLIKKDEGIFEFCGPTPFNFFSILNRNGFLTQWPNQQQINLIDAPDEYTPPTEGYDFEEQITLSIPGQYIFEIELWEDFPCVISDVVTLEIYILDEITTGFPNAGTIQPFCINEIVQLSGSIPQVPLGNLHWEANSDAVNFLVGQNSPNPEIQVDVPGTYTLQYYYSAHTDCLLVDELEIIVVDCYCLELDYFSNTTANCDGTMTFNTFIQTATDFPIESISFSQSDWPESHVEYVGHYFDLLMQISGTVHPSDNDLTEFCYHIDFVNDTICDLIEICIPLDMIVPLEIESESTSLLCHGAPEGSINLTVSGDNGPYSFLWSNGATTEDLANLAAGLYEVSATDINGCQTIQSFEITQPDPIAIMGEITHMPPCHDSDDGTVVMNITGGVSPYALQWYQVLASGELVLMDGETSNTLDGFSPNIQYQFHVTDANGCLTFAEFSTSSELDISADTTPYECLDIVADIILNVTGTHAPFTYSWVAGDGTDSEAEILATTYFFQPITEGEYTVTVTDAEGCQKSLTLTVTRPPSNTDISISPNTTDPLCPGDENGNIFLDVFGGTEPYSFEWSNGVVSSLNYLKYLPAGEYHVTVTDALGCSNQMTITLTDPEVIISNEIMHIQCYEDANGAIDLTVSGDNGPYSFLWSNGATTEDLSDLTAGSYNITISDANGCEITEEFIITEPSEVTVDATVTEPSCSYLSDGSISIVVNGGTAPYDYQWFYTPIENPDFENPEPLPGATDPVLDNLTLDNFYFVFIQDSNGCETYVEFSFGTLHLTLTSTLFPPLCLGDPSGGIDISVTGGTKPHFYEWSTGETTEDLLQITEGVYTVTVTDNNGCTLVEEIDLEVDENIPPMQLTGNIHKDCLDQEAMVDVEVNITPSDICPTVITNNSGNYTCVWQEGEYTITPSKDGDDKCGISGIDLVRLSQYVNNLIPLTPHQIIAADYNGSNNVDELDVQQLRDLILNIDTENPFNTSWRFVPETHVFPDETDPQFWNFPEEVIYNYPDNCANLDFNAIKIGDLNCSAPVDCETNGINDNEMNSGVVVLNGVLENNNTPYSATSPITVSIKTTSDITDLYSYQFAMSFNNLGYELINIIPGDMPGFNKNQNTSVQGGILRFLWLTSDVASPESYTAGTTLFKLVFKAKKGGIIKGTKGGRARLDLKLRDDMLAGQFVNEDLNTNSVLMYGANAKHAESVQVEEPTPFHLYPNPAHSSIYLNLEVENKNGWDIQILDINGRVVKTHHVKNQNQQLKLDISSLDEGTYFIKIKNGKEMFAKRFIKTNH